MKKINQKTLYTATISFVLFVLWTLAICFIERRAIGPEGSVVGLATLNKVAHQLTGTNMFLYTLTDYLSALPLMIVAGFATLGLMQLIKRKSIKKVDFDILALGGFYAVVVAVFVFFEMVEINYRPILIDGALEASYPSSTTMLVMTIIPTAVMQFGYRIKNKPIKRCVCIALMIFTVFMVAARLVSGVHWLTDIIGGALLSFALVMFYRAVYKLK